MAGFKEFDPDSKEEITQLLPFRCMSCLFAHFIVELELIDERLGPMERIQDIGKRCSGYEGSDPTSDMYSEAFDRSGCPSFA